MSLHSQFIPPPSEFQPVPNISATFPQREAPTVLRNTETIPRGNSHSDQEVNGHKP